MFQFFSIGIEKVRGTSFWVVTIPHWISMVRNQEIQRTYIYCYLGQKSSVWTRTCLDLFFARSRSWDFRPLFRTFRSWDRGHQRQLSLTLAIISTSIQKFIVSSTLFHTLWFGAGQSHTIELTVSTLTTIIRPSGQYRWMRNYLLLT